MASARFKTGLRPRYNVDGTEQSLANDGMRRNLEDINGGPFVDGVLIDRIAVTGNIVQNIVHNLGRPPQNLTIIRVDSSINQIIVRFDDTHYASGVDRNARAIIRPSATGVITLWVS